MGYFGALAAKLNKAAAGSTLGRVFRLEGSGHVRCISTYLVFTTLTARVE